MQQLAKIQLAKIARAGSALALVLALAPAAVAQRFPPQMSRSSAAILNALTASAESANASTVSVVRDRERVAYGTVVRPDLIVTKASELGGAGVLCVVGGSAFATTLVGVDDGNDVALLRVERREPLAPVRWAEAAPSPGAWIVSPDGDGAPMSVGILSSPRYQHSRRRGYLGVRLERDSSPPRLNIVQPNTAAEAAGLEANDEVLSINGTLVSDSGALTAAIGQHEPGTEIVLRVKRGDEELTIVARLRMDRRGDRSNQEHVWGPLSEVRAGFGDVLQHDSVLAPDQQGGPIVDLDGRVLGINIARAGRVETLALPADVVRRVVDDLLRSADTLNAELRSSGADQRSRGRQP